MGVQVLYHNSGVEGGGGAFYIKKGVGGAFYISVQKLKRLKGLVEARDLWINALGKATLTTRNSNFLAQGLGVTTLILKFPSLFLPKS